MEPMENVYRPRKEDQMFELPSGFRFHPTDVELINNYLIEKVRDSRFSALAIADVDLNKCEPWDLPGLAKMGETEWYFFCVRDRKYPTGQRTNRATYAGYWKATGKDKGISVGKTIMGMKKTLVFYIGRAPKGEKTDWIMHEYRLEGNLLEQNLAHLERSEWVICRVFEKKSPSGKKMHIPKIGKLSLEEEPLPKTSMDSSYTSEPRTSPSKLSPVTCFSNMNQVNDGNNTHDDIVDSMKTPILNYSSTLGSSDISPAASWGFAKETPTVSNVQSTQIAHQDGNSVCPPDYFVPQEPSMPITLMENNGPSAMQNQKAESSQGRDFGIDISPLIYNNDMFYSFAGDQQLSSASAGLVDIASICNF